MHGPINAPAEIRAPPPLFSAMSHQHIRRKTYRLGLFSCDISCFFGHGCFALLRFVPCFVGESEFGVFEYATSFRSKNKTEHILLIKLTKTMVALTTPGRSMAMAAAILSAVVGAASGEGE